MRTPAFLLALCCIAFLGRGALGLPIIEVEAPEGQPIFSSALAGGAIVGGRGVEIARAIEVAPARNIDKNGVRNSLVVAEGSAFSAGKFPDAFVVIEDDIASEKGLETTIKAWGTGFVDKPLLSGASAFITQQETETGKVLKQKLLVTADSNAAVSASQSDVKGASQVNLEANTLADVNPITGEVRAEQGTNIKLPFDSIKNPPLRTESFETSFGDVVARDPKTGGIVFDLASTP